ncbi:hypothetical protein ACE6H2_003197 [Prunus campanulata]
MGSLRKIKIRNWLNKNTSFILFKKIGEGPMKTHRLPNHQVQVVRNIFLPRKGKMSKKEKVQISVLC